MKRTMSPSAETRDAYKRIRTDLTDEDRGQLKSTLRMGIKSAQSALGAADPPTPDDICYVLAHFLLDFVTAILETPMKDQFIPALTHVEAHTIVDGMGDQYKALAVQNLKDGNWEMFLNLHCGRVVEDSPFWAVRGPRQGSSFSSHSEYYLIILPATKEAWTIPYQGNAHHLFRKAIDKQNKERNRDDVYLNFLPIIQSSGTGKSRLLDETSKLIITIPLNIREGDNGYPNPDVDIRNYLMQFQPDDSFKSLERRYHSFFKTLFDSTRIRIEALCEEQGLSNYESVALALRDSFAYEAGRSEFYAEVSRKATAFFTAAAEKFGHKPSPPETPPKGSKGSRSPATTVENDDQRQADQANNESTRFEREVLESAAQLLAVIRSLWAHSNPSDEEAKRVELMIYFDESHVLCNRPISKDSGLRNAFHALCSSLNLYRKLNIFTVFLSTNSSLSEIAPSKSMHWSLRIRNRRYDNYAPYTELPFDEWEEQMQLKEDKHTLDDVCNIEFYTRFGRPLWWTRWKQGNSEVRADMVSFAMTKLIGRHIEDKSMAKGDTAFLAALSTRLHFDFEPSRTSAVRIENQLVERNMRIAFSVPAHCEYLRSGTPSEPLLAEAAAQFLNSSPETASMAQLDALRDILSSGLIGKGQRGEIVARHLLTRAHDVAIQQLRIEYKNPKLPYSTPIPVILFLKTLFGDAHWEKIANCIPDGGKGDPLKVAFQDMFVHFTHFVKGYDDGTVSDRMGWVCMGRGMGLICRENQDQMDIMLLFTRGKDTKLSTDTVSLMGISVKDRIEAVGSNAATIDAETLQFFTSTTNNLPYINILMQLGVHRTTIWPELPITRRSKPLNNTPQEPRSITPPTTHHRVPVHSPSKLTAGTGHDHATRSVVPKHPRYSINAIGCSPDIYGIIDEKERAIYKELLATESIFDEHQRDHHFGDQILRMKPFWPSCGVAWEGICERETSEPGPEPESPVEGVEVGTGD